MAENQLDKGNPLELGYDKWTNNLLYNNAPSKHCTLPLWGKQTIWFCGQRIRLAFLDQTLVREEKQRLQTKVFALPCFCFGRLICRLFRRQSISSITFDKFLFGLLCFKIYLIAKKLLMKFIVSSNQLLKQLQIWEVINSSNTLPILDNFSLNSIRPFPITASD